MKFYAFAAKPIIDRIFSMILLIILSPFLVILMFLIWIFQGPKIFFIQERIGYKRKKFKLIKFRTMSDEVDTSGLLRPDSNRLTSIGKVLRKFSLDELPQLFNIIKGEMSLIGPRPLLIRYFPYYTETELVRFCVKPGITGLSQISGRNILSWDKRLNLDVEYVNNISLLLDMRIVVLTIKNILLAKNVVVDPESIMKNLDEERRDKLSATI
jgi:lipopolysaccharide/colanic/teichoic acid biosynthesis glycosyltransferase